MDSCMGLINELRNYSREVDEVGNPTEAIADKNKYHHCDALRYICTVFFNYEEEEPVVQPQEPQYVKGSIEDTDKYFTKQAVGLL